MVHKAAGMTASEFKKLRQRLRWNQDEAAKELGVDRTTVTRWENGAVDIPKTAARLMTLLGEQKRGKKKP